MFKLEFLEFIFNWTIIALQCCVGFCHTKCESAVKYTYIWASLVAQERICLPVQETDLIPGLGRSPEEGNDNPLQYSCLGNPMDRGTWQATVSGVASVLNFFIYHYFL